MQRMTVTPVSGELILNYHEILAVCGDFGRYQIILLLLFGFQNLFSSVHYFSQTISSFVPDHWCYHEKLENMSFKEIEMVYKGFHNPSCTKLKDIYDLNNVTKSDEPCTRWIYNYDFGFISMSTELNWVCENSYQSSVGQSFFFVGSVVGTWTFGFLADICGRLPVLAASNLFGALGDFLTIFSDKMWSFSICRLIAGLSVDSDIFLFQLIVLEYINPKWRTLGINLMVGIFFCVGVAISPWIAVLAGNWRTYLCCVSFPYLLVFCYFCLVQESAQWLLTRNNIEGAIKRLKRVARTNKREVDEEIFEQFHHGFDVQMLAKINEKKETIIDLFHGKRIRNMTMILLYESIVISVSYDCVARNITGIGISALATFSLSAVVLLPGSLVIICLQNRIGRKGLSAAILLVTAIVTTFTGLLLTYKKQNSPIVLLFLILISRFCTAVAFDSNQQFAAELIPTCVRGQGVGLIHVVGFAATFSVPYIILLGNYYKAAPSLILGVLNLFGSVMCLFLPETAKKLLPKCVQDFETFGKDEGVCSFICCEKRRRTTG